MTHVHSSTRALAWCAASLLVLGCSDSPTPTVGPPDGGDASPAPSGTSTTAPPSDAGLARDAGSAPGDDQTPPTGDAAAIRAWLDAKAYTRWTCEASPHPARPGSAHSANRICANTLAAAHGAGEFPAGAAMVKELYDSGGKVTGYATSLKTRPGAGEAWYWYEVLGTSVVANGLGDTGSPKTLCAACHAGAGAGTTGHDFVYTQVKP